MPLNARGFFKQALKVIKTLYVHLWLHFGFVLQLYYDGALWRVCMNSVRMDRSNEHALLQSSELAWEMVGVL